MISKCRIRLREHGEEQERAEQHQVDCPLQPGGAAGHNGECSHDDCQQEQDNLCAAESKCQRSLQPAASPSGSSTRSAMTTPTKDSGIPARLTPASMTGDT